MKLCAILIIKLPALCTSLPQSHYYFNGSSFKAIEGPSMVPFRKVIINKHTLSLGLKELLF
ncbi:hypothetical protein DU19_0291 [Chlamydia muridarum]|nr:hypothetical protein DU18_0292 [Chlamydia muridarum]KDU82431.1 hypothetical protein DU19_0291 [Chlamydia muridarum]